MRADTFCQGSLYLSRVTGGSITELEAKNLLVKFGSIEKVWYSTPTDMEMFRLPQGIWVMYAYFQDARDAQAVSYSRTCSFILVLTSQRA